MSRVGKKPVPIPDGVEVSLDKKHLTVKGKLGVLDFMVSEEVEIAIEDKQVIISLGRDTTRGRSLWGTTRSIVSNMVRGVSDGVVVNLEINGVGCKAAVSGDMISLFLGKSHEIRMAISSGIKVVCPKPTLISISGCDNQKVGDFAANVRKLYVPEPYKGKGIKYEKEVVRRKEGKKK